MANSEQKKWYTRWWAIIIYIIAGLGIILLIIPLPEQNNSANGIIQKFRQENPRMDEQKRSLLLDEYAPYYGTTSPKITIVEFFSFNCPGTEEMQDTVRELGIKYQDKIKIIFRHFPTNKEAIEYSLAAECAHKQNKFWGMYDKLFQNQKKLTPNKLIPYARQLGLNTKQFSSCLQDKNTLEIIKQDIRQGTKLGVKGSPTTYINGYKIERPIPKDIFMSIIENIIEVDEDKK